MQERKQIYDNLSLESKNFLNEYLTNVLKLNDVQKMDFIFPDYNKSILNGLAIHDMEKAINRTLLAIKNNQTIAVYGDYDCDGVPGTALLRDVFQKMNYKNVIYYIPHRHNEGYGLHNNAIDILKSQGTELIITIDLGTTNIKEVDYASSLQIDTIITDHHLPHETVDGQILPKAFAIINNKKNSCNYANKDLCGSGTIFKFATCLLSELENIYNDGGTFTKFTKNDFKEQGIVLPQKGYEKWLLDLVGIATIADMVPLTGENRTLAIYGLYVFSKTNRPGLQTLFQNAKTDLRKVTEEDIAFTVAPRINSASRMAHPKIALSMFSTNLEEGINAAHELEELNKSRKEITASITKKLFKMLDERNKKGKLPNIVVVGDSEWNAGILGILAQKVVDKYDVTCFVWGGGEGEESVEKYFKGSCRSNGTIHLVKLMSECAGDFLHFGGHIEAGGFSVSFKSLHTLEENLNSKSNLAVYEKNENNKNFFDLELNNVNADFLNALKLIGPFGMGNEKPFFRIRNFEGYKVSRFGKSKEHLKIVFSGLSNNIYSKKIEREAIKFFTDHNEEEEIIQKLNAGEILFEIEAGYNSNIPRLKIVD